MEQAERRITTTRPFADFVRPLFSLQGRARRTHLLVLSMFSGCFGLPAALLDLLGVRELALSIIITIMAGLVLYVWIAMIVRRLHDQGRPGWLALPLHGVAGLIMLGLALQPQRQYGSPSFSFLFWSFHPAPNAVTTTLSIAFLAWFLVLIAVSLASPQPGPNRYGPDPRI